MENEFIPSVIRLITIAHEGNFNVDYLLTINVYPTITKRYLLPITFVFTFVADLGFFHCIFIHFVKVPN